MRMGGHVVVDTWKGTQEVNPGKFNLNGGCCFPQIQGTSPLVSTICSCPCFLLSNFFMTPFPLSPCLLERDKALTLTMISIWVSRIIYFFLFQEFIKDFWGVEKLKIFCTVLRWGLNRERVYDRAILASSFTVSI